MWAKEAVLQPSFTLAGLAPGPLFTHGLRRALYSCAASQLFVGPLLHFLLAFKVATQPSKAAFKELG